MVQNSPSEGAARVPQLMLTWNQQRLRRRRRRSRRRSRKFGSVRDRARSRLPRLHADALALVSTMPPTSKHWSGVGKGEAFDLVLEYDATVYKVATFCASSSAFAWLPLVA